MKANFKYVCVVFLTVWQSAQCSQDFQRATFFKVVPWEEIKPSKGTRKAGIDPKLCYSVEEGLWQCMQDWLENLYSKESEDLLPAWQKAQDWLCNVWDKLLWNSSKIRKSFFLAEFKRDLKRSGARLGELVDGMVKERNLVRLSLDYKDQVKEQRRLLLKQRGRLEAGVLKLSQEDQEEANDKAQEITSHFDDLGKELDQNYRPATRKEKRRFDIKSKDFVAKIQALNVKELLQKEFQNLLQEGIKQQWEEFVKINNVKADCYQAVTQFITQQYFDHFQEAMEWLGDNWEKELWPKFIGSQKNRALLLHKLDQVADAESDQEAEALLNSWFQNMFNGFVKPKLEVFFDGGLAQEFCDAAIILIGQLNLEDQEKAKEWLKENWENNLWPKVIGSFENKNSLMQVLDEAETAESDEDAQACLNKWFEKMFKQWVKPELDDFIADSGGSESVADTFSENLGSLGGVSSPSISGSGSMRWASPRGPRRLPAVRLGVSTLPLELEVLP